MTRGGTCWRQGITIEPASGLGPDENVAIVAQCGWGPRREAEALVALGQRPDRLVLSYYINDIESATRAPTASCTSCPSARSKWSTSASILWTVMAQRWS